MSGENFGLLYSRSLLQPRLNISINVSLNDMFQIAEPFVTKFSTVISQSGMCKKWVTVFKIKVTVTEFRFIQ